MTITPDRTLTGLESFKQWLDESPIKRYEVIDGTIVVSPQPVPRHDKYTMAILKQLMDACPAGLLVFGGYGWQYDTSQPESYLVPDAAVVREDRVDLDASDNTEPPLLAVETRSPSTWRLDEGIKRDLYAAGGVHSYWLLDPHNPRLRVLQLRDGGYVEVALLESGEELTLELPFPVTLRLP